jgi:hypothetical protein
VKWEEGSCVPGALEGEEKSWVSRR